jgi:hypothetical protein
MSNYEWQKQHTRQRIDARKREAASHRLASEGRHAASTERTEPAPHNPLAAFLRAITGVFAVRRRGPDSPGL